MTTYMFYIYPPYKQVGLQPNDLFHSHGSSCQKSSDNIHKCPENLIHMFQVDMLLKEKITGF